MIDYNIAIIGLPGLYQNWIMSLFSDQVCTKFDGEHNFLCDGPPTITWYKKIVLDLNNLNKFNKHRYVINTYVEDKNFVWYLYNFFEKTDGISITIDNLVEDLFIKAPNTIAFDTLLKHFKQTYNITESANNKEVFNALVEYFYFLLIDNNGHFKKIASQTFNQTINIEYCDFNDPNVLYKKINQNENVSQEWFNRQYNALISRNYKFLNKKSQFVNRFNSKNLDILELAYIGYLLNKNINCTLDWYNESFRNNLINEYNNKIINWHLINS